MTKQSNFDWVPGFGVPHPNADLIKAWADGKVLLVEKQRMAGDKPYGQPLAVQYPCWNPEGWTFGIAKNTQIGLDLETHALVSNRKVKAPPVKKPGVSRISKFSTFR